MLQYIRICTRGGFMGIEYGILDFIAENIRCAFLDPIMAALSIFGNYGMGWIILALPLLIPRKTRTAAATALVAMLIGALAGEFALKHIVCRPRPYLTYEQFHGFAMPFTLNTGPHGGYSFPSGHSCCAFAAAVSSFKINKRVGVITTIVAALVAFSRLYNYVHFPSDVLAGTVIGILCALLVIFVFKKFSVDEKLLRIGINKSN